MSFGRDFVLTLLTNQPGLAARADEAGVQRVGLDLESRGKRERQDAANWISDHREAELTSTVGGERVAVRDAFRLMWDDSADELRTTSASKLAAIPQ